MLAMIEWGSAKYLKIIELSGFLEILTTTKYIPKLLSPTLLLPGYKLTLENLKCALFRHSSSASKCPILYWIIDGDQREKRMGIKGPI